MYRDSDAASLRVFVAGSVPTSVGDKPDLGERGCSRNGVGVVTEDSHRNSQPNRPAFPSGGYEDDPKYYSVYVIFLMSYNCA